MAKKHLLVVQPTLTDLSKLTRCAKNFMIVSFNFSPFDLILYIPHDKLLREADLAHTTVQKHRYHSKDYTMTPFSNSLIDRFSN